MDLKCPKCKVILPYNGYPSNPNVSTIMCVTCGYTGPGYAFHRICSVCGGEFDIEDVTTIEKNGELTVICNKCAANTPAVDDSPAFPELVRELRFNN